MKRSPFSLKKWCIITLIRNYRFINLTAIPPEVASEIMDAIRDPNYHEYTVMIRYVNLYSGGMTRITEFFYQNDPQNPILQYHHRNTQSYMGSHLIRVDTNTSLKYFGIIYDDVKDIYIEAVFTHTTINSDGVGCFLEEELPPKLVNDLAMNEEIYEPVEVPLSQVIPFQK